MPAGLGLRSRRQGVIRYPLFVNGPRLIGDPSGIPPIAKDTESPVTWVGMAGNPWTLAARPGGIIALLKVLGTTGSFVQRLFRSEYSWMAALVSTAQRSQTGSCSKCRDRVGAGRALFVISYWLVPGLPEVLLCLAV